MISLSVCGVGGARGLFAYISWLMVGAAATATKMGVVCLLTDEKMKNYGPLRWFCTCWGRISGKFWRQQMYFSFRLMAHTLPCRISCLLMHFGPSLLPLCPAPYCFRPLHQLSGCNQQSGIEGDACLACFDLKKLKKAHCGLMQVI